MSTGDGEGAQRPTADEAKFESLIKLVREFKAVGREVDAKELLEQARTLNRQLASRIEPQPSLDEV